MRKRTRDGKAKSSCRARTLRDSYQDRGAAPDCAFNGNSPMNRESRAQNGGSAIATAESTGNRCAKLRSTRDSSINVDAFEFPFSTCSCSITKAKVLSLTTEPIDPRSCAKLQNLLLNWTSAALGRLWPSRTRVCLLLLLHFDPFAISSLPDRLICTLSKP